VREEAPADAEPRPAEPRPDEPDEKAAAEENEEEACRRRPAGLAEVTEKPSLAWIRRASRKLTSMRIHRYEPATVRTVGVVVATMANGTDVPTIPCRPPIRASRTSGAPPRGATGAGALPAGPHGSSGGCRRCG
jgi:hypothetical protein